MYTASGKEERVSRRPPTLQAHQQHHVSSQTVTSNTFETASSPPRSQASCFLKLNAGAHKIQQAYSLWSAQSTPGAC